METSPTLKALIRAAEEAARSLLADFVRVEGVRVEEKGPADFVSSADLASQAILERALRQAFPEDELVMEEGARSTPSPGRARIYVDPLDGTTNFVHGIPHFAVAIAREEGGAVGAGVVLNAATGELFFAEKGGGAWLGGEFPRRLRVSDVPRLSHAVLGTGIPHRGGRKHAEYVAALRGHMDEAAGIRRLGSAALDLAYVAAGRFDAFFEQGLHPWDVGAGSLLVTEAGGVVSRTDGGRATLDGRDVLACCNEAIRDAMVAKLAPLGEWRSPNE